MGLYDQWREKMTDDKGFFRGQYEGEDPDMIGGGPKWERRGSPSRDFDGRGYGWRGDTSIDQGVERRLQSEGTYDYRGGGEREFKQKSGFHGLLSKWNDWGMQEDLGDLADEYNVEQRDMDMGNSWRYATTEGRGPDHFSIPGMDSGEDYNQRHQGDWGPPADENTPEMWRVNKMDRGYGERAQGIIENRSQQPNNLLDMIKGIF